MSELKDCPFCGKQPKVSNSWGAGTIGCRTKDCGLGIVVTDDPFSEKAIKKWNKRPLEKPLKSQLEAANEELIATQKQYDQSLRTCDELSEELEAANECISDLQDENIKAAEQLKSARAVMEFYAGFDRGSLGDRARQWIKDNE